MFQEQNAIPPGVDPPETQVFGVGYAFRQGCVLWRRLHGNWKRAPLVDTAIRRKKSRIWMFVGRSGCFRAALNCLILYI